MSRKVAALVYSKQAGSMARKAVLAYFADRANDDGTGVWAAKQRIADEVECSKQTVITTVKGLVADGILLETGKRPNGNGYTVEYAISIVAVEALPDSKSDGQGVQNWTGQDLDGSTSLTARGQTALPKPSLNRPIPTKATPSSGKRAKARPPAMTLIPADFAPVMKPGSITHSTVDGWPPGRLEDELEHFVDHHTTKATLSADWQASWRTWVKNSKKWEPRHGQDQRNFRTAQRGGLSADPTLGAMRDFIGASH